MFKSFHRPIVGFLLLCLVGWVGCAGKGQPGPGVGPGTGDVGVDGSQTGTGGTPGTGGAPTTPSVPFTGTFSIAPKGPTLVKKGTTLQFTTDPAGLAVTWSVVGGNTNGSITGAGLYSPPSTLPLNTQITVKAEIQGVVEEGLIDLRTGDVLSFGTPDPINDTKVYLSAISTEEYPGVSDRIAVRDGSLQVSAIWMTPVSGNEKVAFSQSKDLGGFSSENVLTSNQSGYQWAMSLDLNSQLNPAILMVSAPDWNSPRVFQFLASSNQGQSFNNPIPVPMSNGQNKAVAGSMQFDGQNRPHVALTEQIFAAGGGINDPFSLVSYGKSGDGGSNWSTTKAVKAPSAGQPQCSPDIDVSDDGNQIYLCYTQGPGCFHPNQVSGAIWLAVSTDGGTNFNASEVVAGENNRNCRVAVGPQGELYLSYATWDTTPQVNRFNVFLEKSTDGGANFADPVKANPTAEEGAELGLVLMDVDSLGRVDLVWKVNNIRMQSGILTNGLAHARSLDGISINSFKNLITPVSNQSATYYVRGMDHDNAGRLHLLYGSNQLYPWDYDFDIFYLLGE